MIDNISEKTEELKVKVTIGSLYIEMNAILRKVSRRFTGQPTKRELARISDIKKEIKNMKEGRWEGSDG